MDWSAHLKDDPTFQVAGLRLALRVEEAAAALGVSPDFYAERIQPELKIVRRGRVKLVSVGELQRWLDENGEGTP